MDKRHFSLECGVGSALSYVNTKSFHPRTSNSTSKQYDNITIHLIFLLCMFGSLQITRGDVPSANLEMWG